MVQELLSIKQKLISLKFGNDLNVVKNIDERLQRLLVMFDFKPEDGASSSSSTLLEDSSLERQDPINVCPETFKGTTFGYPLYQSGFMTESCDFARNISKLVTIVFDFITVPEHSMSEQNVSELINQTMNTYPGVRLKIATKYKLSSRPNLETITSFPHQLKVPSLSMNFEKKRS